MPIVQSPSLINGLGGSAGFGENTFDRNDDEQISIDLTPVFGPNGIQITDVNFTSLELSNNGYISFRYVDINETMITEARFRLYGEDLDTRNDANTLTPGGTSTGTNLVYWDMDPSSGKITITWDDVAQFPEGTVPKIAGQIILTSLGNGNAIMEYRYEYTAIDDVGASLYVNRSNIDNGDEPFVNRPMIENFFYEEEFIPSHDTEGNGGTVGIWKWKIMNGIISPVSMIEGTNRGEKLVGTTDNDTIYSFAGNDTVYAYAGNDTIDGGSGKDLMYGGLGDDTFYVDNSLDNVKEFSNEGTDTVITTLSTYTLSAHVEYLTYDGESNARLTGNNLNNTLIGSFGDDTLNGGTGEDYMLGGSGNDTYIVDNAYDYILENSDDGIDTIQTVLSECWMDSNLEILTYTGRAATTLMGNSIGNVITAGRGNDTIDARGGDDALFGGLGNDTLSGGSGSDAFVFNTALNARTNVDTITDFNTIDDTIYLSSSIFRSLTSGPINPDMFVVGTQAVDANDYLIYDNTTGKLYYDANANGRGGMVQIALLGTSEHPELTASDFLVYTSDAYIVDLFSGMMVR